MHAQTKNSKLVLKRLLFGVHLRGNYIESHFILFVLARGFKNITDAKEYTKATEAQGSQDTKGPLWVFRTLLIYDISYQKLLR